VTTSDPAVTTEGLTKRFGDFTAVDAFDLRVEAGTVVSLLGPNGAGKTTIVRMLATLLAPTSGSATVCGHDVIREADAVRGLISLTGQFAALEDNLTARENLMLMARLRGFGKGAATRVVDRLIHFPGGSGAGSTSPPAWSSNPAFSSSTSPPPGSTRAAAKWSGPPSGIWSRRG
jgi:ABC-type multidrug transport system ATPase subunit